MMRINAAFDAIRTARAREAYEQARQPPPPRDGTGGAGRPPGRPSGSVLDFGRHIGWSLGEVARFDPGYLVWLAERPRVSRIARRSTACSPGSASGETGNTTRRPIPGGAVSAAPDRRFASSRKSRCAHASDPIESDGARR
jgi:hypothetical protein